MSTLPFSPEGPQRKRPFRRRRTTILAAFAVSLCTACITQGAEHAAVDVVAGAPFELSFMPAPDHNYVLWLRYDLRYAGPDFALTGPFSIGPTHTEVLDLHLEGMAVAGANQYTRLKTFQLSSAAGGETSGTVWLADLPAPSPGDPIEVQGTWSAGPGTEVTALRLTINE